jgi:hypothetical protein
MKNLSMRGCNIGVKLLELLITGSSERPILSVSVCQPITTMGFRLSRDRAADFWMSIVGTWPWKLESHLNISNTIKHGITKGYQLGLCIYDYYVLRQNFSDQFKFMNFLTNHRLIDLHSFDIQLQCKVFGLELRYAM